MALSLFGPASDASLLRRYANGDAKAARLLTERHAPRVLSVARRMLGPVAEAEDVAQDVMIKLWKAAPTWDENGGAKLSTWLYRVTSNLCIDHLRKRRTVGLDQIAEPEDDTPSEAAKMQTQHRAAAVHNGLAALPERQRLALTLRHFEELSNPEIADIMDLSVEAVESLTARAKRALATHLIGHKDALGVLD